MKQQRKFKKWRRRYWCDCNSMNVGYEKRCSRCGEWYPADTEFYPRGAAFTGGIYPYCYACNQESARERYAAKNGVLAHG